MASIRKRTDRSTKPWQARYRDPSGRERSQHFARKGDAERWLATIRADVVRGQWIDPAGGRTRFATWAERVFAATVDLRPSTRARDESYYRNHVEPTFGSLQLRAIDHLLVREWIAALSASAAAQKAPTWMDLAAGTDVTYSIRDENQLVSGGGTGSGGSGEHAVRVFSLGAGEGGPSE